MLKNPANGGIPVSASVPAMNVQNVIGIGRASPPIRFMSLVATAWMMLPAPRKSSALKTRVGDQMEHPGGVPEHAEAEHHVAELAHRRVREHALDVVLHDAHRGGDQRR